MICPNCKETIEDDSFYCDQCGRELWICPKCQTIGITKFCVKDGTKLIPKKEYRFEQQMIKEDSQKISNISKMLEKESIRKVSKEKELFQEIQLISKNTSIVLNIQKEAIIGREGDFSKELQNFPYISRKHAKIWYDANKGWCIQDLNSTNGTKYNGKKLTPQEIQILEENSILEIANLVFEVKIFSSYYTKRV